ncbi:hypothetical protein Q8A73_008446 [Channa argus]|nr:hypothetical protein Q8A73_008446 [Channa argus]
MMNEAAGFGNVAVKINVTHNAADTTGVFSKPKPQQSGPVVMVISSTERRSCLEEKHNRRRRRSRRRQQVEGEDEEEKEIPTCATKAILSRHLLLPPPSFLSPHSVTPGQEVKEGGQKLKEKPPYGVKWKSMAPLSFLFILLLLSRLKQQPIATKDKKLKQDKRSFPSILLPPPPPLMQYKLSPSAQSSPLCL